MRIGIVFFGLPRCSRMTLPTIEQYILGALPADAEVFIHSSLSYQTAITNLRSQEAGKVEAENYTFFTQYPHIFTTPEQLLDTELYQQLLAYGDKQWADNGASLRNLMLQLNSLRLGYLACRQHGCDFYLFVRPDLLIHDAIPIVDFIEKMQDERAVMLPGWQWHRGVNDRFCLATQRAADVFGLRYERMLDFCQKTGREMHSERFLAYELQVNNVVVRTCTARMSRVRVSGQQVEEEFSPLRRMGGIRAALRAQWLQIRSYDRFTGILKVVGYRLMKVLK